MMKKLAVQIAFLFTYALVNAQGQFSNFGNFNTFPGVSVTYFGNFHNNGTFTDDGQAVSFNGGSGQSISGTSVTTLYNLVVNASSSSVTMTQNLVVSNSLVLTSGALNLNSRTLTVTNNSPTALSRTSGYIVSEQTDNSSKLIWNIGTNTGSHVFPFGTATGGYIPFTLAVTAGDIGNVSASTFPTAADNTPYPTAPTSVTHVNAGAGDNSTNVVDRFWQIDKDGPSGTATLIFVATAAEIGTITTLRAQRWNSSTGFWDDALSGQSNTVNSATVAGVTTFSPWTLSGNNTPLPVDLINFTAKAIEVGVDLKWKTLSEINNDYFTVQRSVDGIYFSSIGKVLGGGTSYTTKNYQYTDMNVVSGRYYYRLKQVDLNGDYEFSDVRMIEIDYRSQVEFIAHPNPVTDKFIIRSTGDRLIKSITIVNAGGMIINTNKFDWSYNGDFDLGGNPSGLYLIKVEHDHGTSYVKLVKE